MLKIQSGNRSRVLVPALFFCVTAAGVAQPAIDFSYAGYGGGGVSAPVAPAVISVRPSGTDDTELLQGALDHVSALAPRADGFRGAVLLRPGRYRVTGRLEMRTSGVVLRGRGNATIVAAGKRRRTLIEIGSSRDPPTRAAVRLLEGIWPHRAPSVALGGAGGVSPG